MLKAAVEKANQFNAAHPWSHNDFYQRWVLRTLPMRFGSILDVGCGTGNLVRALTSRANLAVGMDTDAAVITTAREFSTNHPTACFDVGDLMAETGAGSYDAVTAIAVVHHLPLRDALQQMRALLAPRGTIIIVGCYRAHTRTDHLLDVVAIPANLIMGALLSARAPQARVAMSARTAPPGTTLDEIRAAAADVLPGAQVRRRLFWRYTLVYRAASE